MHVEDLQKNTLDELKDKNVKRDGLISVYIDVPSPTTGRSILGIAYGMAGKSPFGAADVRAGAAIDDRNNTNIRVVSFQIPVMRGEDYEVKIEWNEGEEPADINAIKTRAFFIS